MKTIRLYADRNEKSYMTVVITAYISMIMGFGAVFSLYKIWEDIAFLPFLCLVAAAGAVSAVIAIIYGNKNKLFLLTAIIPIVIIIAASGGLGVLRGCTAWINKIITCWNTRHKAGVRLINMGASSRDIYIFTIFIAYVSGQLSTWFAMKHKILCASFFSIFWIVMPLISDTFSPFACACVMAGFLCVIMCGNKIMHDFRIVFWGTALCIILFIMAFVSIKSDEYNYIVDIRDNIKTFVHDVRYGKDTLPLGNLHEADTLNDDNGILMTVSAQQEKQLYLKGFCGAVYDENIGKWEPLYESSYGGDNTGMMHWLKKQNFTPLTQTASYYSLCEENERPQPDTLKIKVMNATRYFIYVPSSFRNVLKINASEKKDMYLKSNSVFGSKMYEVEEISSTKPSELMIADSWVSNPQTDEQKKYCEAEAVYRNFVYENYTQISDDMNTLMNDIFWEDYESDSDGIYSAVCHIRDVLKTKKQYALKYDMPDDCEPVSWFITDSQSGNSSLYASTAVFALRAHGIPARYVEGYYISNQEIADAKGEAVKVTGNNAHAWAEVYFDGIGWQPVDITPGYYYDVMSLEQMINIPDSSRKSAAVEDDKSESGNIVNNDKNGHGMKELPVRAARNISLVILGVAAFIMIVFVLLILIGEIRILYNISKIKKYYIKGKIQECVSQVEIWIYMALAVRKIDAGLGWNTENTDEKIAKTYSLIEKGEYIRISELLEKRVYGGINLEAYELRTLQDFLERLTRPQKKDGLFMRLKLRYIFARRTADNEK